MEEVESDSLKESWYRLISITAIINSFFVSLIHTIRDILRDIKIG